MTSCDNVDSQQELTTAVTRATFNTVIPSERLEIYFKLSPVQKLSLWKSKLNQSAAQTVTELQREAILSLDNKLSEELFSQNDINIFENEIFMDWLDRYGDSFTEIEGILIFEDLVDFNPASTVNFKSTRTYREMLIADKQNSYNTKEEDKNSVSARYEKPECTCRHGAYCSSIGDCENNTEFCEDTNLGCGWLWLQSCNGLCGEEMPPDPQ